ARDAGPSLHPLINGNVSAAFAHQPAMGWFAILFRAPVVFFARHASTLVEYRVGTVPCLLVAAALGIWLASRMRGRDASLLAATAVAVGGAVFVLPEIIGSHHVLSSTYALSHASTSAQPASI